MNDYPEFDLDIERLKKFYNVSSLEELAQAQADHVERLQNRLVAHDILPKSFVHSRVREG